MRAALAAAGAVLALSLLGSGWGWLRADAALRQQLDLLLAAEAGGLVRDYDDLGAAGLVTAVQAYARRTGPLRVLLLTADGRPVAGRPFGAPPAGLRGYATVVQAGADGDSTWWRVLGAALPGGLTLVVGADLRAVQGAAQALAWTPPLAALGAAAAALLLGFLAARRLEARLAAVSDAARAVMAGDLSRRLPADAGRGDEFDRLVAAVNQVLARVEALVAAQRQVTDDIAHDLRGPLSRLRLRLEDAAARPRDPVRDAEALAAGIAELDEVLATFAALLRIAGAEAGAARARFRHLDLSALAQGIAEAYAPVVEDAGRPFVAEIAAGVGLCGDAELLRQALANLLDNALLHGAGAVALRLRPGPVLSVEDDGPGVPEGEREAVLRRFVRLERSRTTPGTGLGLALAAAAASAHGGRLQLVPTHGDGTGLRAVLDLSGTAGPRAAAQAG